MHRAFPLVLLLAACSGSSSDGMTEDDGDAIRLVLLDPQPGAEYAAEAPVPLEVEARRGDRSMAVSAATWTIGDWTGEGKKTEAVGLPTGPLTVQVEATVGEETLTASVDIVVAEPVQTSWVYAGTLSADVTVSTTDFGDFDDRCEAPIQLALDSGTLTGSGRCVVFEDFDLDPLAFTMEGTVAGGAVSGNLVMSADGEEARTPFTGNGTAGGTLTASFDNTFRDSGNSIRIAGTWTATPE